jgi:hypothetical protein
VGAVEALGFVRGRQPEQHDHRLRRIRRCDGFRAEGVVVAGVADSIARGEGDVGEGGGELVEDVLDLRGDDLRAACALVAGAAGELADDGDPALVRERQDRGAVGSRVVLQQDDRLRRGGPGQLVMGIGVVVLVEVQDAHALVDQL